MQLGKLIVRLIKLFHKSIVARLHANDAFVKQLNKAKDEFSKLQKAGLVQSVSKK